MQFTTIAALAMSVVAVSAQTTKIGELDLYNFSDCSVEPALTIELMDQQCHDLDAGYGAAASSVEREIYQCMTYLWSEKGCKGELVKNEPGTCSANTDGVARQSYAIYCA